MPRKCFEVFYEVFGKRFVLFSFGFDVFGGFCPVWVLYNIKRGLDAPPGAHRAAPRTEALVPLPRLTLYRVPLCQTVTQWQHTLLPICCSVLLCAYAAHMGHNVARLPCPSFCRALSHAYARNTQSHRRSFSCPSFCLALSCSGRDEMFGQARWQLFRRAVGIPIVSSHCM